MQNEYRISFYHPKACQPETTPILYHDPTRTHAHAHTTGSNYTPNKLGVCYEYSPLIYYFLSLIYMMNVYSRREGYFGGVRSVW